MTEEQSQLQVKQEEVKDASNDLEDCFPLISYKQIQITQEDTLLNQELDEKMHTLDHEARYKWIGDQLPPIKLDGPNQIRVFVITWNKHGLMIGSQLRKLLRSDELKHHLVVFGSQECQRSIGFSIFCDSKEEWENQIYIELGKEYVKVASNKLNALHLCVIAHESIVHFIDEKQMGNIATGTHLFETSLGFLNIVGNKGAVAISVKIGNKRFLFINNHLASGQDVQEERNREFYKIKTEFPFDKDSLLSLEQKFDYTIWIGDFNTRINDNHLTMKNIQQKSFLELLSKDQFLESRKRCDMYNGFKEGMILFPPSYKLVPNDRQYSGQKDWRIPGWTDRIIFYENKNQCLAPTKGRLNQIQHFNQADEESTLSNLSIKQNMILINYDSATDVWGSDHRPVFAQFCIKI